MSEPDILDQDIRAMKEWLRVAWQRLAEPRLTSSARRELRHQMRECSAELRLQLQAAALRELPQLDGPTGAFGKPELGASVAI